MVIAKSHLSGSVLVSITLCWIVTGTLLEYPVVALCRGNPVALGLWVRQVHVLQQIIDGLDVGRAKK